MTLSYEKLNFIKILLFALTLAICGGIETVWPARSWEIGRWKRWLFHLLVSVFNSFWTRLTAVSLLMMLIRVCESHQWGLSRMMGLSGAGEILATLVLFDGFNYWWHRLSHRIPLLWRFHRAHHADTHVDVTTSLRFHPGELFISYFVKALWIVLWGPSLLGLMIFETAITFYAQFHHSNIDFPDFVEKKLRWVHMTPRLHASHHTVTSRTRDANFSTIFLFWDKLFRSYQEPEREELKQLGLPGRREKDLNPASFLLSPFHSQSIRDQDRRIL